MTQEAEDARIAKKQWDLSVTTTGELRCLRFITYNIINEMVQRRDKSIYEFELPMQSGIEDRHSTSYQSSY